MKSAAKTSKTRKKSQRRPPDRHPDPTDGGSSRRAEIIHTTTEGTIPRKQIELPSVDYVVCILERDHPIGRLLWEQGEAFSRDANFRFAIVDRAGLSAFCGTRDLAPVAEALSAPAPKGQSLLVWFAKDGVEIALHDDFEVVSAGNSASVTVRCPKGPTPTASVSQAALVARLKRKLAHDGLLLRASRGAGRRADLGDFYLVDNATGGIADTHVDLKQLGRELGVLAPEESVA